MTSINDLLSLLEKKRVLLSDGAMGTVLHQRITIGSESYDSLNLTNPDVIENIHRDYIEAGSDIIQTNTFGANSYKLARHGEKNKLAEINRAGVAIARHVVESSGRKVLIAGDVGPLGVRLAPFGRVQLAEAREAFAQQISELVKAGVDLIIIETMADLYEIVEAVSASKQVAPDLPVIASMTYTRDNRTLLGDPPARVARRLKEAGADIIGVNCSGGPNQVLNILRQMRRVLPDALYSVMPNAGWPEQVEGRIMYPAIPEYFGGYAPTFWQAGASIIGGCCGTTPAHIAAMSRALINISTLEREKVEQSTIQLETKDIKPEALPPTPLAQKLQDGRFVIAVEMDPPRGLATQKILAGASLLADSGADVIDVADSPMARMRMSPWAVCSLIQQKVGIDTVLHFPTRGRNVLRVQGDLLAAHALNVRNVFVVMGDPTSIGEYPDAMDNYDLVPSGLIKLIKQGLNLGLDHSGSDIGQPTSFFVGCALNLRPANIADEIKNLKRKLKAGADFILTQPIYDAHLVTDFLKAYELENGKLTIPLIVGLLPLASARHAAFLQSEVPGIEIPQSTRDLMEKSGDQGARVGINLTIELIHQIKSSVQGIYLMPAFQRYDYAAEIIEGARK
ncbi:MAG: bifunctional homocysteine S-methyltransferase/methylenetetrahydrofolate reductase [Anaerolineaceae bacterium]|nr:bifunctional homocysteine S-methyltransferase/methylenetetrahydrofolate reductase [Anaerolineaceae bacterium]